MCTWDLGGISMLWEDSLSLKVPLRLYWESAFVGGFSGMLWSHSGIRGALKEYESIWGSVKDPGAWGSSCPCLWVWFVAVGDSSSTPSRLCLTRVLEVLWGRWGASEGL